jgi:hypothetical protein
MTSILIICRKSSPNKNSLFVKSASIKVVPLSDTNPVAVLRSDLTPRTAIVNGEQQKAPLGEPKPQVSVGKGAIL